MGRSSAKNGQESGNGNFAGNNHVRVKTTKVETLLVTSSGWFEKEIIPIKRGIDVSSILWTMLAWRCDNGMIVQ